MPTIADFARPAYVVAYETEQGPVVESTPDPRARFSLVRHALREASAAVLTRVRDGRQWFAGPSGNPDKDFDLRAIKRAA